MFAQKNLHVNTNSRHEPEAFQLHGAKRASKDSELRTSQYIYIYVKNNMTGAIYDVMW